MDQETPALTQAARVAGEAFARQIISDRTSLVAAMVAIKQIIVRTALANTKQNQTQAAKLLKYSRNALLRVLKGVDKAA